MLAADGTVIGKNAAADEWLEELGASGLDAIPIEVHALAARLRAHELPVSVPQLRVSYARGTVGDLARVLDAQPSAMRSRSSSSERPPTRPLQL